MSVSAITQRGPTGLASNVHQTTYFNSCQYVGRIHSGAILTYFLTYSTPGRTLEMSVSVITLPKLESDTSEVISYEISYEYAITYEVNF